MRKSKVVFVTSIKNGLAMIVFKVNKNTHTFAAPESVLKDSNTVFRPLGLEKIAWTSKSLEFNTQTIYFPGTYDYLPLLQTRRFWDFIQDAGFSKIA
jgi:hypothetical protein